MVNNEEYFEYLGYAKTMVEKMPEWKKGMLEASSKTTSSIPREPVNTSSNENSDNLNPSKT